MLVQRGSYYEPRTAPSEPKKRANDELTPISSVQSLNQNHIQDRLNCALAIFRRYQLLTLTSILMGCLNSSLPRPNNFTPSRIAFPIAPASLRVWSGKTKSLLFCGGITWKKQPRSHKTTFDGHVKFLNLLSQSSGIAV